ncbi:MAG: hypothetical protein BM556_04245 [Bacteriovorax sp. MedPE-SWde]|nr:MAG: hypothetical protein BM556_04245 [Bacteriovorax sp. MedPE-SWde]
MGTKDIHNSLEEWISSLKSSKDLENSFLLDLFDVSLFITNIDGELIYKNKTFSESFKLEETESSNFYQLLLTPLSKEIYESLKKHNSFFGEVSWKRGTSTRYGDLKLKYYQSEEDSILIGSLRDITHRKNNEKQKNFLMQDTLSELSSAQNMLMESTKMATVGKLSLEINHELQIPLQTILASQSFLKTRLDQLKLEDSEISEIIEETSNAVAKIRRQLETLKNKSSFCSEEIEEVNSGDVILNSINYFSHKSKTKKIKVLAEIHKNFVINCNYDKFENVILNLIRNSFDAHLENDNPPEEMYIKVSSFDDSNHFQMAVEDNGPGIEDSIAVQIFEPFFSTKEKNGTGIGLSLSRRYIESLGGDIFLNQSDGKTRFQISLPKQHYKD